MKWGKSTIGEHCEITSSKRIFYSEYVESGVPFYRSKEIIEKYQGQVISEPLFISRQKFIEIKNKFGVPKSGDLLLTSVGTIGIPYIVKYEDEFYFKDGNLTWFRKFDDQLYVKYLYYWILSTTGKGVLLNSVIGSSQKALTIAALKAISLSLPPIEMQKRIADILSAYDDLIENNQKQIKLLEEAAQRLYKEWFIDFHFPGYETTPIVNGIPEGWERGSLSVIGKFVRGTTITKTQAKENGVVPVVAGGLEPAYFHDVANTVAPVITVSGSGANAGYVKIYFENIFASDCSFLDSRAKYLFFCYCTLKNMTQQLDSLQKGAAQPHVYAKDINSLQILLPSNKYLSDFCSTVKPFFDRIGRLEQEKKLLTEARDRLLPKLMSGEIEV